MQISISSPMGSAFVACALATILAGCSSSNNGIPTASSATIPSGLGPSSGERITITEFSDLPKSPYFFPLALTAGPDGALWVADDIDQDARASTIVGLRVRVSARARSVTRISQPGIRRSCLWVRRSVVKRRTTRGRVTEFSNGITLTERPFDIAARPDGAMWFTEFESTGSSYITNSKIGRITMNGAIKEYPTRDSKSEPQGIAAGSDGNMWFVETQINRLGRVNL